MARMRAADDIDWGAMQEERVKWINKARTHLPAALRTLQRCVSGPCDPEQFKQARELVYRWLGYERACESQKVYEDARAGRFKAMKQ